MRLTLLYSGLFLVSGVLLLGIANFGVRSDVAVVPFLKAPPALTGVIVLRIPRPRPEESGLDRLAASSLLALVIMAVISLGLGWWVAGRALRPLRTITATARQISATNLHERLDLQGPDDEVKELGETLDELFGRLEASFESQRHFVANASHELRTPLTAERALLQVALADPDCRAASLRATCEELLTLGCATGAADRVAADPGHERAGRRAVGSARSRRGRRARVVAVRRHELERHGLRLDAAFNAAPVAGDPSLVESLVANLVDNAMRHNVDGGRVEVSTVGVAGRATIAVRNTGPVVAAGDLERLFQPFQRLGAERVHADGHGLGLAIVRAIVDAHGATLTARARPEGGLDIEVTFREMAG